MPFSRLRTRKSRNSVLKRSPIHGPVPPARLSRNNRPMHPAAPFLVRRQDSCQLRPWCSPPVMSRRRRLGAGLVSATPVLTNATMSPGSAAWLRKLRPRLGDGGVCHAAPLPPSPGRRGEANGARSGAGRNEIQRLIAAACARWWTMQALGERTVILDCDVIQAERRHTDGCHHRRGRGSGAGAECAGRAGTLKQSPMKQLVAATSVGIVAASCCSTLCYRRIRRPRWI